MTTYIDLFQSLRDLPVTWVYQPFEYQNIRDRLEAELLTELPTADVADTSPNSAILDVVAGDTYAMGLLFSAMAAATTPAKWSGSVLDHAGSWFGRRGARGDETEEEYKFRLLSLPHEGQLVTEAGIEASVITNFTGILGDVSLVPDYATGIITANVIPKFWRRCFNERRRNSHTGLS